VTTPVFGATRLDDEGVNQGYINAIDCVGAGVSCARSGIVGTVTVAGGAGTPGGGSTSVQFNQGNAFSGDNDLLWFQDSNTLVISSDAGQSGYAMIISSDTGALNANLSHDGSAFLSSIQLGTNLPYTEIQDVSTNNRLLGRATAGAGVIEEITLGTNLSYTGTTLNAAGGGATPGGSSTQIQYNMGNAFSADTTFKWFEESNTLVISRDVGQTFSSDAITISNDSGVRVFNISGDGSIFSSGNLYVTGSGANSLKIGQGATASGINSTVIGNDSTSSATDTLVVGRNLRSVSGSSSSVFIGSNITNTSTSSSAVCIGENFSCSATNSAACIGRGGTCSAANAVTLGAGASVANQESIGIGTNATSTASQQLVIGGGTFEISDVYISEGVVNASPVNTAINATGGSGTNIAGANLRIASGKGTGNASAGDLNFSLSRRLAGGSTLQGLHNVIVLSPTADTVRIVSYHPTMDVVVISGDNLQTGELLRFTSNDGVTYANVSPDGAIFTRSTIRSNRSTDIGWSIVDQTDNQACNTGCTSACVFGIENATGTAVTNLVNCDAATADLCACAGEN